MEEGILSGSMLHLIARSLSLKVLPVELPIETWPVGIVQNRTLSPAAQLFIDCAQKMSKALGDL